MNSDANIKTNAEYRAYLTSKADLIIEKNQKEACNQCCNCPAIFASNTANPKAPYTFSSSSDTSRPIGYEDSDLKPSENIFFSLTIVPLGTATGPSLK